MGLVFDLAEAVNIAVGTASGGAVAPIQDRVRDRSFRRKVAEQCQEVSQLQEVPLAAILDLIADTDFLVAAITGDDESITTDPRVSELAASVLGDLDSRGVSNLRHTFAMDVLDQASIVEVQTLLGHESVATTRRNLTAGPHELRDAVAATSTGAALRRAEAQSAVDE